MTHSCIRLGAMLSVLALVACGTDRAEEARVGGEMAHQETAAQAVRACSLLDVQGASRIIGPGTEHPGGDTEAWTCVYSNPGVAMLTLQLGGPELYDQITILKPHTPVQIGDRARYHVQETGVVAVQFVAGAYSATLSVQPMSGVQSDYLEPLISVAREVASRLP